jgi:hypothetical protein
VVSAFWVEVLTGTVQQAECHCTGCVGGHAPQVL